jgi:uncharacterized membrane protein
LKLPRITVRDLVLLVAIVGLALGWAREHQRAEALAVVVAAADRNFENASRLVDLLKEALAECMEESRRVDAELQVREAAGPR